MSYTSEDVEAARRISEGLRAAGIVVWFDQNALQGGDAWDSRIVREIRSCAIFIPIISAATESRAEGYFRREWRLAIERERDIADDQPFLLPVVIDDTSEATARVPDRFREIHWTRLHEGEVSPEFSAHLVRLLQPGQRSESPVARTPMPGATSAAARTRQWDWRALILSILALAALIPGLKYLWTRAHIAGEPQQTAAPVSAAERSIVVLPFVDMSRDHDQEYFADGLTEELIDHLSRTAGLRVIARTSSFYFKGRPSTVQEIGHILNVTHVLEGSVRKNGNTLRVTAQFIRASDGVHLWSQAYDRTLSDLFQVQTEIASQVTAAMDAVLSDVPGPARSTSNLEAYNAFLEGTFFYNRGAAGDRIRAIDAFRHALALDANYSYAWVGLGKVYIRYAGSPELEVAEGERLALDAVHRALAADPNLPMAWRALGTIERELRWRWDAASADYQQGLRYVSDRGEELRLRLDQEFLKAMRTGGFSEEHSKLLEESLSRNPIDSALMRALAYDYLYDGQFAKAMPILRRAEQFSPSSDAGASSLAYALMLMGRYDEALLAANQEPNETAKSQILSMLMWSKGERAKSDRYVAELEKDSQRSRFTMAQIYTWRGQTELAFQALQDAVGLRETAITYLRLDPILRRLQGDPRYLALLRKMDLQD